jgi:hypothetical protein
MLQAGPVKQVYQFKASRNGYHDGQVKEEAGTDCNAEKQDVDYEEINDEFGIALSCNRCFLFPVDQVEANTSQDKIDQDDNINGPYHRSVHE